MDPFLLDTMEIIIRNILFSVEKFMIPLQNFSLFIRQAGVGKSCAKCAKSVSVPVTQKTWKGEMSDPGGTAFFWAISHRGSSSTRKIFPSDRMKIHQKQFRLQWLSEIWATPYFVQKSFPPLFCPRFSAKRPNLARQGQWHVHTCESCENRLERQMEVNHASQKSRTRSTFVKMIFVQQRRELQNALHLLRFSVPSECVWALFSFRVDGQIFGQIHHEQYKTMSWLLKLCPHPKVNWNIQCSFLPTNCTHSNKRKTFL